MFILIFVIEGKSCDLGAKMSEVLGIYLQRVFVVVYWNRTIFPLDIC